MKVALLAHTKVSNSFIECVLGQIPYSAWGDNEVTSGQMVALTAIRTCYSSNVPSEIVQLEGEKYFGNQAKDGKGGTDADRLMRHIVNSGHTSTLEHITFTFAIEGVSRSLLAQITRHRHFSFSVQSQRYVKFGSGDKTEGFDYVVPQSIKENKWKEVSESMDFIGDNGYECSIETAETIYKEMMEHIQYAYDMLREAGVPAEDARMVLPNAATTNFVLTGNLRTLLDFYSKRSAKGAQWEIRELAELLKKNVIEAEPWTEQFFTTK